MIGFHTIFCMPNEREKYYENNKCMIKGVMKRISLRCEWSPTINITVSGLPTTNITLKLTTPSLFDFLTRTTDFHLGLVVVVLVA